MELTCWWNQLWIIFMNMKSITAAQHQQHTIQFQSFLWEWKDWIECVCWAACGPREWMNEISSPSPLLLWVNGGGTPQCSAKRREREERELIEWFHFSRHWVGWDGLGLLLLGGLWALAAPMAPPKGADQPSQSINSNSIKQRKGMKWMKTNEGKSIMKATCLLEWLIAAASFGGMNGMVGPSAQGAAEALKLNGMRWNAEAWVGVPPAGHKPTNSTNFSFQFDFMALNEIKWRKVLICWSVEWVKKYYNSK